MVLHMESISHGLRYMEKPSHDCSWGGKEGTWAGIALVSSPVLGRSRSGTPANMVCAPRSETALCESPPFLAPLSCPFNADAERRDYHNRPGGRADSLQSSSPPAPLCVVIYLVQAALFPARHRPSWIARQEERNGEGADQGRQTAVFWFSWD